MSTETLTLSVQAIHNLLTGSRTKIAAARADLAEMTFDAPNSAITDKFYHQGYQNGRIAELEPLVTALELLLATHEATKGKS
jgi:hypothetical protein